MDPPRLAYLNDASGTNKRVMPSYFNHKAHYTVVIPKANMNINEEFAYIREQCERGPWASTRERDKTTYKFADSTDGLAFKMRFG